MFELSPHINKDKIFLVNLSEIEGRLDPYYFHPKFKIINEKLPQSKQTKLKEISTNIFSGITPKSGGEAYTSPDNGIPFIRSGDFSEENTIDFSKVKYIKKEIHNNLMASSKIFKDDILIAIVGATIGKVGIYKYDIEANINQAICGVRINKDKYLPDFVQIFLLTNLGQLILDRLKRPVARANINLEEISQISLPLISLTTQKKIIDIYSNSIKSKQQKEAQADELLNSIDDYLLNELGITLPKKDNLLKNRIFKVNFSEITGKRWDTFYSQSFFKENVENIYNGKYPITELKNIIKNNLIKGKLPNNEQKDGNNKVVQISSIDNNGDIDFTNLITAKDIFTKEQKIKNGDVIIVITGATIGKISIWDYNGDFYLGGDLVKFQTKDNINPFYVFSILRTSPLQIEIERNITGATNGHLSPFDIEHFPIPVPPIEKQNEIAEHIKSIRKQAKQLKLEAKEVLEQAKLEVEKMILE